MQIRSIKTHKITQRDTDITQILDTYITDVAENSVVAVTSKIVSITEGRMVSLDSADKDALIAQEAQYFLPRDKNPYQTSFTITRNLLVATAGIDESNAHGHYILWPKDLQRSVNAIRAHIRKRFRVKNVGVIITDSRTLPLRWGVIGLTLSYSGFVPLKDYIGTPDLFGRTFEHEKLNIADSLASSAVLVMGEGKEQTPLAIIEKIPHIQFVDADPSQEELKAFSIDMQSDLYGPFLQAVKWKKGITSEE